MFPHLHLLRCDAISRLGEPAEISFVGWDHRNAQSPRAHRDQRTISQTSMPDFS